MLPKYFLAILIITIFAACKKDNINIYAVVSLTTCTSKIPNIQSICFDSVLDSRCPKNVMCVWAGIGVAKFTMSVNNTKYQFTLATSSIANYKQETIIAGYKIKLINLLPYPDASIPPIPATSIKAELEITKQ